MENTHAPGRGDRVPQPIPDLLVSTRRFLRTLATHRFPEESFQTSDYENLITFCRELGDCCFRGDRRIDGILEGVKLQEIGVSLEAHRQHIAAMLGTEIVGVAGGIRRLVRRILQISTGYCKSYFACLWIQAMLRVLVKRIGLRRPRRKLMKSEPLGLPPEWLAPLSLGQRQTAKSNIGALEGVSRIDLSSFRCRTVPMGTPFDFLFRKEKYPLVVFRDEYTPRTLTSAIALTVATQVFSRQAVGLESTKEELESEAEQIVEETRRIANLMQANCAVRFLPDKGQGNVLVSLEDIPAGEELIIEDSLDKGKNGIPLKLRYYAEHFVGAPVAQRAATMLAACKMMNVDQRVPSEIGDILVEGFIPFYVKYADLLDKWTLEVPNVEPPRVPSRVPTPKQSRTRKARRTRGTRGTGRLVGGPPPTKRRTRRGVRTMKSIRKSWEIINRELFRLD